MARPAVRLLSAGVVCVVTASLTACNSNHPGDTNHEVVSTNIRSGPGFGDQVPPRASNGQAAIAGGLRRLTADTRCSALYPSYISVYRGGAEVPGLYECADTAGVSTEVHNTSDDLVWSLLSPANFIYWSASESAGQPLAVQLFRATLRPGATNPNQPLITIEPGSVVTIPAYWKTIRMNQDAGVQLAWDAVTTAVETVQNNAEQDVEDLIVEGFPTRGAVLTCAKSGYDLGKQLAEASDQPPEEPSEQLALVFGVGNDVSECRQAIQEAAERERAEGRAASLTFDDLRVTTQDIKWRGKINVNVGGAWEKFLALARRG
jgi:hypothetical protein